MTVGGVLHQTSHVAPRSEYSNRSLNLDVVNLIITSYWQKSTVKT